MTTIEEIKRRIELKRQLITLIRKDIKDLKAQLMEVDKK
jgi:hypothetical protein